MRSVPRLLFALTLLPAACGDDDGGSGAIAWIEVVPGGLLLTPDRGSAALEAIAYDADGNQVEASFTWASSTPDQIEVDASGKVSAVAELGSATVWAEADGVRSNPIVVAMVELYPGSVVVGDDQVVEVGEPFDPEGAGEDDLPQLDVRLRDIDVPSPGTILVAAETATVGGAVVSAEEDGGEVAVRLQLLALPDMIARYELDWQIDLAGYHIRAPVEEEGAASAREIAAALLPVEQKIKASEWPRTGPFRCSASLTAFLERNFVDLKLGGDAEFVFKSSRRDETLPPSYLKVAIEGPLTLKGSLALKARAGLQARGKCELKTRIPMALGPFAIVVAPAIPLGVGVSLDAKLIAASMEIGFEGENGFDLGLGFECGPGTMPCRPLNRVDWISRLKPLLEIPRGMKDTRVEMNAQVYFLTGVDLLIGMGKWTAEVFEVTVGPIQAGKLAFIDNQADDRSYASNYDLKLQGKAGAGSDVDKAIKKLLGKNEEDGRLGLEVTVSSTLAKSPIGTLTSDKQQVSPHKKVKFTVDLAADSVKYFLLGYNVASIELYRKNVDEPGYEHMKSIEVSASNQTRFTWDWTPGNNDIGKWEFFAFVKTSMPVIELEIAQDSARMVEVVGICSGAALAAAVPGGDGGCEVTGSMSWVMVNETPTGTITTTADASVTMVYDEAASDTVLTFRPNGTWGATHGGTTNGCTVTVQPNPMTGLLTGQDSQGVFQVDTPTDGPWIYQGLIATGPFPVTTMLTCEGVPPFTQEQQFDFNVWKVDGSQMFAMDQETGRAMGSYTETSESAPGFIQTQTWTWDLTLNIPAPEEPPPPLQ
jgi:hypothetical protein